MNGDTGGIRIGRFLGIPVYLHFSWFVIFGLITWSLATGYFPTREPDLPEAAYWVKGLVASLLFFVSILLHELAHAVVAVRHGVVIRSVTLFIFGGVAQMDSDPEEARVELKIAAAGPATSLLLAAAFYGASVLMAEGAPGHAVARYLALINLVLAVFNLVPAFPLDGGRLLRGLLWPSRGKLRATQTAANAGRAFAYGLIGLGVMSLLGGSGMGGIWYILIGWFLKDAATWAYQRARLDEVLEGVTVRDAMTGEVAMLPAEISLAEAGSEYFLRTGYGGYPVVRGESVVGLLCLKDLLQRSAEQRAETSVQGAMRPLDGGIVVSPDEPLLGAMARMAATGVGRLLVMDQERLVGLLTMSSLLRHVRVREQFLR